MTATTDALKKLPYQFKDKENWGKLITIIGDKYQELYDVFDDIENAFDIDTAVGDQLDKIGGLLGFPRYGYGDSDYRKILKAIASILFPNRGNAKTLLDIIHALLDPDVEQVIYQENYPASYLITLVGDNLPLLEILKILLPYGKPAGVGMHVAEAVVDAFKYDDADNPILPPENGYSSEDDNTLGGEYAGIII
jgi:hypothetical protein